MHIDWFIVVSLAITFVLAGYALWLSGKGPQEKSPSEREQAEKPASH